MTTHLTHPNPTHPNPTITLKLFAAYQDAIGQAELTQTIAPETTIAALLEHLLQQYPQLEPWRHLTRFGVNLAFVNADTILQDGDEVALIPPVSGG